MSILLTIHHRLVKSALLALALVVILFFALTRTEVGREALRVQIEQQFAQSFDGRLTIGELRGNLIQDVFASDIRVHDGAGRLVAQVDSATFRPRWRDLIVRTINSGRIELHRPKVHLTFDEDGPNLAKIFRIESERTEPQGPWSFQSADVHIIDGVVTSSNEGYVDARIDQNTVFDYTRSRVDDIHGRMLLEVGSGHATLNLRSLAMELRRPEFHIAQLSGQVEIGASEIELRSLNVAAGGTSAHFHATLPLGPTPEPHAVELAVESASIDFDSLRVLLPSLPLAATADLSANVYGTSESVVIEFLEFALGSTRLLASGTLVETPDGLDVELALDESTARISDLEILLPGLDLEPYRRIESVAGDAYVAGLIRPAYDGGRPTYAIDGSVRLESAQGRVEGPFSIARDDLSVLTVAGDLDVRGLLAHRLIPELAHRYSEINGRLVVDAVSGGHTGGTASVMLSRSLIAGHLLDSVLVAVDLDAEHFGGRGFALQDGARASLDAEYDRANGLLEAELVVADLDAGRWWLRGDSVRTRLDGRVAITASGKSLDGLDGQLVAEVSESEIWHGDRMQVIPVHRHEARLQQSGSTPFLSIGGDVLDFELRADASLSAVRHALASWRPSLEDALDRESLRNSRAEVDSLTIELHRPVLPPSTHLAPVRVSADARVLNSRILGTIYSELELIETDLSLAADLQIDADAFEFAAHVTGDSLVAGVYRADSLETVLHLLARRAKEDALETGVSFDVKTGLMTLAGQHFTDSHARLELTQESGSLTVRSGGSNSGDSIDLVALLDPTEGTRRMYVDSLRIAASGYEWTLDGRPSLDFYVDAIDVRALQLSSNTIDTDRPQRFRLDGVLSRHHDDTLSAFIDHVHIGEISEMLRTRHPVDGELNGRISLTWPDDQPELTGRLDVEEARFDGRLVGRVDIRSMYVPGETDIRLDARVSPIDGDVNEQAPLNDLRLYGSVRFPVPGADQFLADPGLLNLNLDVQHADAFFFDYIFGEISDARGVLSGTGGVRGTFRRPVFEADLTLHDGGMRIPDFNLAYDVDGAVVVDSSAIRLSDVHVRDATGGLGVVNGDILFNEYRFFSFDLRAALNDTQFMNVASARDMSFYGDVRASGNVALTGPLHAATLSSNDAVIHPDSRVYIAILEETHSPDTGFIVFADSSGHVPDMSRPAQRRHVLSERPVGERMFVDGLEMDLNILTPQGTRVHLVIDPYLGDVINATADGRIQLLRTEGDYYTYGVLNVDSGDYLFTAGDVFVRRFLLDGGRISWDGDPANAALDIEASYRTRASAAGLNLAGSDRLRIPLIVRMDVTGRVAAPSVGLRLLVDRDSRETITAYESLESILNQPERSAEYATSVMLTNSFMLTTSITSAGEAGLATTRNQLAFNSLSQLVATQLNRYLSQTLPNVDVNLGLQGESTQDLDVTYGVALRLLDERLVIRGQGLYQNEAYRNSQQNLLDEFVVEVRVSNSVSVEVFYRRENDILASDHLLANTTGAGLSYETQFSSWSRLLRRLFGQPASTSDSVSTDEYAEHTE